MCLISEVSNIPTFAENRETKLDFKIVCKNTKMIHRFSISFFTGTVSVLYLIFLVTLKAIRLGFHLEFHWFVPTEFFVPGELLQTNKELISCDNATFKLTIFNHCYSKTSNGIFYMSIFINAVELKIRPQVKLLWFSCS